jgi:hypothetical protein
MHVVDVYRKSRQLDLESRVAHLENVNRILEVVIGAVGRDIACTSLPSLAGNSAESF